MRSVQPPQRIEPGELTEADELAWFDVQLRLRRGRGGSFLWTRSLMQDGRDADLMLSRAQWADVATPAYAWFCDSPDCFWCSECFPVVTPPEIDLTPSV